MGIAMMPAPRRKVNGDARRDETGDVRGLPIKLRQNEEKGVEDTDISISLPTTRQCQWGTKADSPST